MIKNNLIQKYNVPGPRYTSYPTVPYWETTPGSSEWMESIKDALVQSEKVGSGAALYLHIPFCESLCTYCGCNTRITRNRSVGQPYIETLLKEWGLYLAKIGRKIPISEIHLGGGTPTFLTPGELTYLIENLLKGGNVLPGAEFSVEADPRVTTREHLAALAEVGFKRLSLGIQDFDPKVQEIVHRIQSVEQVGKTVRDARELGYTSINFDLIYGLPFQTEKSIRDTLTAVRELRPDRIAFYAYAHVPWIKPSQRRFTEQDLPVGESKRKLYELGRELLETAGYREIGMDHFALASDSLSVSERSKTLHRNFMGYTSRHVSPLIALGVSAIGDSWRAFAQNEKLLETYVNRVEKGELPVFRGHVLSEEDLTLRTHILNLMTRFETAWTTQDLQTPFLESIRPRLEEFERDGLLELRGAGCTVTETGRPFLRNICMAFDARLFRKSPDTQLFSQTI